MVYLDSPICTELLDTGVLPSLSILYDNPDHKRIVKYIADLEARLKEYKDENAKLQSSARSSLSNTTSFQPGFLEKDLNRLQTERDKFRERYDSEFLRPSCLLRTCRRKYFASGNRQKARAAPQAA